MESTPNNHDGASPKRRKLDDTLTPGSATIDRIVATSTTSPLRQSSMLYDRDGFNSEQDSEHELPLTQDPSIHQTANATSPTPPLDTATTTATPAPNAATNAATTAAQYSSFTAFQPIVPFDEITSDDMQIICDAIEDVKRTQNK
jgi:hypothetical protein